MVFRVTRYSFNSTYAGPQIAWLTAEGDRGPHCSAAWLQAVMPISGSLCARTLHPCILPLLFSC